MAFLALATLFQGAAGHLSRTLSECQTLEQLALSHVAPEETTTLQSFDSLTQTLEQFQSLFQRLAGQEDVLGITISADAVEQVTLAALRERLTGSSEPSSQYAGDIELF
ncbi:hypothetical protein Gbth_051_039 [Gluconobacter thailandicus F149-1 = NBRC 100600]|uniref:Uncharacterized protein n=1 Tax=Gluconobacter thailandicus NBRC 3257 TaxID=1381097 RepID=A0ABQ0IXE0_GLUTH|nr:hypothetical protein [Gluconobacter thailandicus]ANQ41116.1 hypothetical protein BAR24_06395 [Gluconobacter oxydans]GAN88823.1 hypothetical protein Gbfr_001_040 [Gluconobacter frateurii M-2]KXV53877.1 hypothetical protein AD946_05680 [Gluconobacter thailandicus]GAC88640.1 hypothetical protein NBRC3255_2301 [Gluconobacter thailandicus NBRC 3255]GAD26871.1 hypothetical protein NBRC3257_1870 [Gluconobacter thailandicus NBRC 3257]